MRKDLVLYLTSRCNFTCSHCLRGPAGDADAPMKTIRFFLDDMKQAGYSTVSLTGGEPALHPDFPEVIDAIADRGLEYTFVTNGYNIEPYIRAEQKHPKLCNALAVSLDGPTEEIHNYLRKKGFNQAVEAIRTFAGMGLPVSVNMLVTEKNMDSVPELIRLAASLGASSVWLAGALPNPQGIETMAWEGGRKQVKIAAIKASREQNIEVNFASCYLRIVDVMKCINMRDPQLTLNREGEIVFCCNTQGRGAVLGRYRKKQLGKFLKKAEALGRELIEKKMILYKENRLDEFSSNCHFCDACLSYSIMFFSDKLKN